jgi:hypothetical protein
LIGEWPRGTFAAISFPGSIRLGGGSAITQSQIADVCYWLSAFAITATVTFLYKH